ncbi:YfbR-like 5'-deoxynucleotidase, partial [Staphylococcus hominis]|uniref:YfbR-like 5'-deoxynucleotidase n=1 Tax=Staphylococcus hominis TaxID=1290 RepID=UPI0028CB8AD7
TVEQYHGNSIDSKSFYQKPLNHDFPQLFTAHINTPLKYPTRQLKILFSQLQEQILHTFINQQIPNPYQHIYRKTLQQKKDHSLEAQ